jgi:hypothetical protein
VTDAPENVATGAPSWRFGWAEGLVVLGCSLLMAPAFGFLWHVVAPRVPVRVASDGLDYLNAEPGQFFDADGMFAVLGFAIGILIGVLVCLRWRHLPLGVILGATVGGLVGSVIAVWVGESLGPATVSAAGHSLGTILHAPLRLRSEVFVLAWPAGVLIVLLAVTAWRDDRRGLDPDGTGPDHTSPDAVEIDPDAGSVELQPRDLPSSATSPSA